MPGEFTRNADFSLPVERLKRTIGAAGGEGGVSFVDATSIATALLGNAIAANMFMLGYAYQTGNVPLSGEGHRTGDRAQRRSGQDESRRLHLGSPRGCRARRWSPR